MQKLVSIIIPTYNTEKYVRKCIKSIQKQTYKTIEIIIVDDGSTDNTIKICEDISNRDERISIIKKQNGGPSSAKNVGLDVCTGDYVICVDSDDWVELNYIERLVCDIECYNADLAVCDFYKDKNGSSSYKFCEGLEFLDKYEAMKYVILPSKYYGFNWNKLYKKSVIGAQRFDEKISKGEDSLFNCEYIASKCNTVVYDHIPLYHYRIDTTSISRSKFNVKKMTVLDAYAKIVEKLRDRHYSEEIISLQEVQYANQLLSLIFNIMQTDVHQYNKEFNLISEQMGKFCLLYLHSDYIDLKHKIAYILTLCFKPLVKFLVNKTDTERNGL